MERLFVAGLCGLAYGLAEVIEAFAAHGVHSSIMIMGGGASRSPLVRQIMADTTGLTVALPQTKEPVLLGAAMLGAVAGGGFASIGETMAKMSALGRLSEPTAPGMAEFHSRKRKAYKLLREVDRSSREAMAGFELTLPR
jgi:D-ribulokinase